MKTIALLSLALVVAAAAHAEAGAEDFDLQNRTQAAPSSLTRAEVMDEYMRAAAAGEVQYGEGGSAFVVNQQAGSPRDVGAGKDEAIQAARQHPTDLRRTQAPSPCRPAAGCGRGEGGGHPGRPQAPAGRRLSPGPQSLPPASDRMRATSACPRSLAARRAV